jgi:hypothetical protein
MSHLHGGNGPLGGGGNTLLQTSQISCKSRLVTHSGGNATQQSRHLRVSLGEAENVIYEEQHILTLHVTEVLSNRQPCHVREWEIQYLF